MCHREEAFGQVEGLVDAFFKDLPYNKLDFMIGLMMLSGLYTHHMQKWCIDIGVYIFLPCPHRCIIDYYKNTPIRSGSIVKNYDLASSARYYIRFASACFGWKFIYGILLKRADGVFRGMTGCVATHT